MPVDALERKPVSPSTGVRLLDLCNFSGRMHGGLTEIQQRVSILCELYYGRSIAKPEPGEYQLSIYQYTIFPAVW